MKRFQRISVFAMVMAIALQFLPVQQAQAHHRHRHWGYGHTAYGYPYGYGYGYPGYSWGGYGPYRHWHHDRIGYVGGRYWR